MVSTAAGVYGLIIRYLHCRFPLQASDVAIQSVGAVGRRETTHSIERCRQQPTTRDNLHDLPKIHKKLQQEKQKKAQKLQQEKQREVE